MSQRSLDQPTAVEDPAWPIIRNWITDACQVVEVMSAERAQAEATLLHIAGHTDFTVVGEGHEEAVHSQPNGYRARALEEPDSGWVRLRS